MDVETIKQHLIRVAVMFILIIVLFALLILAMGGFWPALAILLLGIFVAFPLWLMKDARDLLAKVLAAQKPVFWKINKLIEMALWTAFAAYTYSGSDFFDSERWRKIVVEIDDADKTKPKETAVK